MEVTSGLWWPQFPYLHKCVAEVVRDVDRRQREKPGVRDKAMGSARRGCLFKVLGYFKRRGGRRAYGICWAYGATSRLFNCRPKPRIFSETSESAFLPSLHLPSQFQRLGLVRLSPPRPVEVGAGVQREERNSLRAEPCWPYCPGPGPCLG